MSNPTAPLKSWVLSPPRHLVSINGCRTVTGIPAWPGIKSVSVEAVIALHVFSVEYWLQSLQWDFHGEFGFVVNSFPRAMKRQRISRLLWCLYSIPASV